jgi:citrate lyase subunit beta/citryl-CoA lyase
MMETPRGILNAQAIAEASPHLKALVMGTSDLAKDLHCAHTPSRLPMLYALSHCLMAARAAGLSVIDGVHLDLNDDEGFREQCKQGRELGFDGKTLIHPKTIAAANELFAPDQAAIDWAKRVMAASARGEGVVLLDDKLIENLHVVDAHRIVALAEAIAAK